MHTGKHDCSNLSKAKQQVRVSLPTAKFDIIRLKRQYSSSCTGISCSSYKFMVILNCFSNCFFLLFDPKMIDKKLCKLGSVFAEGYGKKKVEWVRVRVVIKIYLLSDFQFNILI